MLKLNFNNKWLLFRSLAISIFVLLPFAFKDHTSLACAKQIYGSNNQHSCSVLFASNTSLDFTLLGLGVVLSEILLVMFWRRSDFFKKLRTNGSKRSKQILGWISPVVAYLFYVGYSSIITTLSPKLADGSTLYVDTTIAVSIILFVYFYRLPIKRQQQVQFYIKDLLIAILSAGLLLTIYFFMHHRSQSIYEYEIFRNHNGTYQYSQPFFGAGISPINAVVLCFISISLPLIRIYNSTFNKKRIAGFKPKELFK